MNQRKNLNNNTNLFSLRKSSCRVIAFREKCCTITYLQNLYGEPMFFWENNVYAPFKSRYLKFAFFFPLLSFSPFLVLYENNKPILSHFDNALFTHPTFIAFDAVFLIWWIIPFGARQNQSGSRSQWTWDFLLYILEKYILVYLVLN